MGEALDELATAAGFSWNAIVVNPPHPADSYGGSWDRWGVDWLNRVDMVAVWFFPNPYRRRLGFSYPEPFYDLQPVLVTRSYTRNARPEDFWSALGFWARPFHSSTWVALLGIVVAAAVAGGFVEGHIPHLRDLYDDPVASCNVVLIHAWRGVYAFFRGNVVPFQDEPNTWSGRLLGLAWFLMVWIVRSSFIATYTWMSIERTTSSPMVAQSWSDLISTGQVACMRRSTGLTNYLLDYVPTSQRLMLGGGGLTAEQDEFADHLRAGECAGMAIPRWFAEAALIGAANVQCDLRIVYPAITEVPIRGGGWIVASSRLRAQALRGTDGAGVGSSFSGGCEYVMADTIGPHLQQLVFSGRLDVWRQRSLTRSRSVDNKCGYDGAPRSARIVAGSEALRPYDVFGPLLVLALAICAAILWHFCDDRKKIAHREEQMSQVFHDGIMMAEASHITPHLPHDHITPHLSCRRQRATSSTCAVDGMSTRNMPARNMPAVSGGTKTDTSVCQ